MTDLIVAAAQSCSLAGQVECNLARHRQLMHAAASRGVQLLVFPELSLSGYEPALAERLAQAPDTAVLQPLQDLAHSLGMTTVVGLPLRYPGEKALYIGAWVLGANGERSVYAKQHLHPGEDEVFSAGVGGPALSVRGRQVALAVCADFSQARHPALAAQAGAQVYAASVLISEQGYPHDRDLLQGYAVQHLMAVLMANHGGPSGGWQCAGRSAFWAPDGECIVAAAGTGECLVIARHDGQRWQGQVHSIADQEV